MNNYGKCNIIVGEKDICAMRPNHRRRYFCRSSSGNFSMA